MAKGFKTGGKNFKPGVVTNPNGRPRIPDDIKLARSLTQAEFIRIVNQYMSMGRDSVAEELKSSTTPMLNLMVAQLITKAAIEGDQYRLNFILDRLIGKVPTPITASIDPSLMEIFESLKDKSENELLAIVNGSRLESQE